VVETTASEDYETVTREVGVGAAEYLLRVLDPADTIAISWGGSLLGMVNALETATRSRPTTGRAVAQALGGLGNPNHEVHASDLTRRLARIINAEALILPAPGVAGTRAAGRALQQDPNVQSTLSLAAQARLAFMGIGAPRKDSILIQNGTIVAWEELARLERQGAVGDINLRYFDRHGRHVASELDSRVVGLNLTEIKGIKTVVGVAGGAAKLAAIQGALAGRLVDVLVTDHITAHHLLEETD
ncbi:MAG: sugar-binding domain-containing protein, partial [Anaerolineales bacterium]|nr:sugar-binding domain-containing protein [Anaerolineales bacterium]